MTTPINHQVNREIPEKKEIASASTITSADIKNKNASGTTRSPSVVQVNDNIFRHYQATEWVRNFRPAAPATTILQPVSPPVVGKIDHAAKRSAESNSFKCEEILARPTPQYEKHQLVGRPSEKGDITITVCIGKLPTELAPDEACLPEIFDVVNRFTIQKPYPCDPTRMLDVGDAIVFRQNHDGTHSTRQVRLLETLLECLLAHGTQSVKEILKGLGPSQRLPLKLGTFSLRIGRVDETDTHAKYSDTNGWKIRSAQIFQAYAKQLPAERVSKDQISWVASLISQACNPEELLPKAITQDDKSYFGVQLLACVHELDLYRCYTKEGMQKPIEKVKSFLFIQTGDSRKANDFQSRLEKYALNLMVATGTGIRYTDQNYNLPLFRANSLDAKYCWQTTGNVEKPIW